MSALGDGPMDGDDVRSAAAQCVAFLRAHEDADWSAAIPDMEWTVAQAVTHFAETGLWYSIDLTAGGPELQAVEHHLKIESEPSELIAALETYAAILADVIDAAPADRRGYHPYGASDRTGFAAMGCDEILIHTDDAARGLGTAFRPDPVLAERVLKRIFPWAPTGIDPWAALRWANGRIELPDRPRLQGWAWFSPPLEEWDGVPRTGATPTAG